MARPQVEDGHTKIANELLEAIVVTYFSPAEHTVFWDIVRRTYGWNKKSDRISYSQFEQSTKMNRRHIAPALKRLIGRNIITCTGSGQVLEYGLQKDYELWLPLPKSVTATITEIGNETITKTGNEPLPKQVTVTDPKPLPILGQTITYSGETITEIGNETITEIGNHKRHKDITKDIIQKTTREDLPEKKKWGEFNNVFLGDEEYEKLTGRFSKQWTDNYIEQLSGWIQQSKKNTNKYTDHYATLRNWLLRDGKDGKIQQNSGTPKQPQYTPQRNYGD